MLKKLALIAMIALGTAGIAQAADTTQNVTPKTVLAQDTGDLEPCVGHCPCDPRCPDHIVSNKAPKSSKAIKKTVLK
jgi:opacity protein-like surface antigen